MVAIVYSRWVSGPLCTSICSPHRGFLKASWSNSSNDAFAAKGSFVESVPWYPIIIRRFHAYDVDPIIDVLNSIPSL